MPHWELLLFFMAIAFIYSSVGFGGGSSYLAVLSLYHLPVNEMKLTALTCNIIVVTGSSILFLKNGQVNFKKILPLVMLSVPMAYLGGKLPISEHLFFIMLGVSLLAASVLLWIKTRTVQNMPPLALADNYAVNGATGGIIGFLSGMVGIGGGIFLSPILNLMRWDTSKKIAATAAFFILVNSISGIAGQLSKINAGTNYTQIGLLSAAVLVGGQIGSRVGIKKFDQAVVRRVTALLVFAAGVEVLYKHI